jgi:uncharacterized OsmC-like protein
LSEPFSVSLEHWKNFQFMVDFNQEGVAPLLTDEAAPLGEGEGPSPSRLLAAAVGNCLAASLVFCLKKAQIEPQHLKAVVEGEMTRNERGRLRINELRVRLEPQFTPEDLERSGRCAALFEDFCIVKESVRAGIDVVVEMKPVVVDPIPI